MLENVSLICMQPKTDIYYEKVDLFSKTSRLNHLFRSTAVRIEKRFEGNLSQKNIIYQIQHTLFVQHLNSLYLFLHTISFTID